MLKFISASLMLRKHSAAQLKKRSKLKKTCFLLIVICYQIFVFINLLQFNFSQMKYYPTKTTHGQGQANSNDQKQK